MKNTNLWVLYRCYFISLVLLILSGCANYAIKNNLFESFKNEGLDVQAADGRVVLFLPEVYFRFNSAVLTQSAKGSLMVISGIINTLEQAPKMIYVDGHTDSLGDVTYNEALSFRRAKAVAKILVESGVNKNRLVVQGYGKIKPAEPNHNAVGRAKNRRVEIGLVFDG